MIDLTNVKDATCEASLSLLVAYRFFQQALAAAFRLGGVTRALF